MPNDNSVLDLSVIIPFKDKSDLTIACINTLHKYGPVVKEVLLISNNSTESELEAVKSVASTYSNTKVALYNEPFNYQKLNNWAIRKTSGKVVMLMNNDIELTEKSKGLMQKMYATARQKNTGAVGCVLLYADKSTIQHAGVYLIPGGTADHLYIGQDPAKVKDRIISGEYPYDIRNRLEVSAVTAAAVMIERKKLDSIKGMDEGFIICGGDVDLCLRLNEEGFHNYVVGLNYGYMIHKESKTRSLLSVPYIDFIKSYNSYIKHFSFSTGDRYVDWKRVPKNG